VLPIKFTAVPPKLIHNGDYDYGSKQMAMGMYEKLKQPLKLYTIHFCPIMLLFSVPHK
jgi:hypothetical protein